MSVIMSQLTPKLISCYIFCRRPSDAMGQLCSQSNVVGSESYVYRLGEMTRNNGCYAIKGHSKSPLSVLMEYDMFISISE